MPWPVYIMPVVNVNKTGGVAVKSTVIVINVQSAYSTYTPVIITDIYVADPVYASVIIIVDWDVLYLDHGSVIVVLYKWIIVIPGVEGYLGASEINIGTKVYTVVNKKVELSIGIDRKCNSIFNKDKRVVIAESPV